MRIYRIADSRHPVWNGFGAALLGGRWNSPGTELIYGSLSFACCMLEVLVHANIGRIPTSHRCVVATVPEHIAVERLSHEALPAAWDEDESPQARAVGDLWLKEQRSAVLLVPSVVARWEWNVLVNPAHPDFPHIQVSEPSPVTWDRRLFRQAT